MTPPTIDPIRIVAQEMVRISADLIYADSHNWSKRPCSTCQTISTLLGLDFGCVRKAKEK